MAQVVLCAGLVPAALVILLGLREPVVMPKSFVVVGWMAPVLIAAVALAFVLLLRTRLAPHTLDGLWDRAFLACVLIWFLVAALRILTLNRVPVPV